MGKSLKIVRVPLVSLKTKVSKKLTLKMLNTYFLMLLK